MKILIHNIQELVGTHSPTHALRGSAMSILPRIPDSWIVIDGEEISDFGDMDSVPDMDGMDQVIDATGRVVMPSFVDSHTHMVFAKSREQEFVMRIEGKSYEQIAMEGGGILNSAQALASTSENQLYEDASKRLDEWASWGTGYFEIKSGYGLTVESELKILRVIKRLKEDGKYPIKSTFLGAHAYPTAYKKNHEGYLNQIVDDMLPIISKEGLADYIDVFCEEGFFSVEESEIVLRAGAKHGLKPKIHANQLYNSGGVQLGVKYGAISVDHLETIDKDEIDCLYNSSTIATLLPGAAFFLGMHYQPARKMIDAGLAVALASDFNPGSCPTGNLLYIMTMACTQMRMTPNEAINALTVNGAAALESLSDYGTITKGKKANIIITKPIPSLDFLPYYYGSQLIEANFVHGKNIV